MTDAAALQESCRALRRRVQETRYRLEQYMLGLSDNMHQADIARRPRDLLLKREASRLHAEKQALEEERRATSKRIAELRTPMPGEGYAVAVMNRAEADAVERDWAEEEAVRIAKWKADRKAYLRSLKNPLLQRLIDEDD